MMHMTFYWGRSVTLLFDSWKTDSWLTYTLTLLACFAVSGFYQLLEDKRLKLTRTGARKPKDVEVPLLPRKVGGKFSAARIGGTVLFGVNSGLGYLLMLAVMSFNGGVFLAIVLGLTVGYLVFRSGNDDIAEVGESESTCACAQ